MRAGKGRDKDVLPSGNCCAAARARLSSLLLDRSTPPAPVANAASQSIPDWAQPPLSAGLIQARHSETESNYRHNYDCDPVQPGFVFKWTHLPCVPETRLLRTGHWVQRLVSCSGSSSLNYRSHTCVSYTVHMWWLFDYFVFSLS